ncbi:MAG TPA: hypothetical protein VI541_05155 [Actinomycetota bacterium]|nr:hypothetical protein [Actinomycetota bacterium]
MKRRTFDLLMSIGGLVITLVMVIAGVLLFWGYNFANESVTQQLSAQKIFFPEKGSEALAPPEIGPYLNRYAGQQLVTGEQALAYSDHFIAVHLKAVAGGKTYSEASTAARANPNDPKLASQVQTLFRGETLRGLLLNAYAFWKIGQLARLGSIAAFSVGGIMLILTGLGFWHSRRASPADEVLADKIRTRTVTAA